jgi:hypothetical protein
VNSISTDVPETSRTGDLKITFNSVGQDKESVRLGNDQSLVFHGTVRAMVHTNVLMDHYI